MLDLDFNAEQEMLRDTVRERAAPPTAPCRWSAQLEDDPVGYPPELWKQLGELDLIGLLLPEEHGGSGMIALEGVVLYEELGRVPRPHRRTSSSAVLCGGALARRARRPQQASGWRGLASGRGHLHPGLARAREQLRARRASSCGPWPTATASGSTGTKRHVAFAAAADRARRPGPHGRTAPTTSTSSSSTRRAPGVDPHPAVLHRPPTPSTSVDLRRRPRRRRRPHRRARDRAGRTWDARHARRLHPPRRPGHGRGPPRARHHRPVRQGPPPVRQAPRRLPGPRPLPGRRRRPPSTGATTLVHEAAWARAEGRPVDRLAPMAKLFACQTFRDVTAMAQQVFGGIGFTRRVRHPALLPPGQAAPDLVVGHPLPRGAGGRGRPTGGRGPA